MMIEIVIYLSAGLIVLSCSKGFVNMLKSAKVFILGALLVLFWPFLLLLIYIDLIDKSKQAFRNDGK